MMTYQQHIRLCIYFTGTIIWSGILMYWVMPVVTSSVMNFSYGGCEINLIDTPGHKDFSEDTYRTLTAVDSAVMLLDAASGVESQTKKLFEVCAMRRTPVIAFINKMDRDGREPFDLIDEIAQV